MVSCAPLSPREEWTCAAVRRYDTHSDRFGRGVDGFVLVARDQCERVLLYARYLRRLQRARNARWGEKARRNHPFGQVWKKVLIAVQAGGCTDRGCGWPRRVVPEELSWVSYPGTLGLSLPSSLGVHVAVCSRTLNTRCSKGSLSTCGTERELRQWGLSCVLYVEPSWLHWVHTARRALLCCLLRRGEEVYYRIRQVWNWC